MKKAFRLLSMFMAVICLFTFSLFQPIYGVTMQFESEEERDKAIESYNNIWNDLDSKGLDYSPIVGELTELRDENTKQFRRADGAVELIMYPYAVHYEKNGRWEAIDNTLIQTVDETGRTVYKNASNDFQVEFGSQTNSISIAYQGETLSIVPISERVLQAKVINTASTKTGLTDEERDAVWRFPEELTSAVSYSASGSGIENELESIEYRMNGKSLSEFITLGSKPGSAPVYSYELNTSLTPALSEKTLLLLNDTGETVLIIDAPNMVDANGAESFDFAVSLTPDGDGYVYSITPDYEWLSDTARDYPVVIDPDVRPNYRGSISDTIISKVNRDTNYQYVNGIKMDRIKIACHNKYSALIKLD